jgi:ribosomal protein L34E
MRRVDAGVDDADSDSTAVVADGPGLIGLDERTAVGEVGPRQRIRSSAASTSLALSARIATLDVVTSSATYGIVRYVAQTPCRSPAGAWQAAFSRREPMIWRCARTAVRFFQRGLGTARFGSFSPTRTRTQPFGRTRDWIACEICGVGLPAIEGHRSTATRRTRKEPRQIFQRERPWTCVSSCLLLRTPCARVLQLICATAVPYSLKRVRSLVSRDLRARAA